MKTTETTVAAKHSFTWCGFIGCIWVYLTVTQYEFSGPSVYFATSPKSTRSSRVINKFTGEAHGQLGFALPLGRIELDVNKNQSTTVRLVGSANRLKAESHTF